MSFFPFSRRLFRHTSICCACANLFGRPGAGEKGEKQWRSWRAPSWKPPYGSRFERHLRLSLKSLLDPMAHFLIPLCFFSTTRDVLRFSCSSFDGFLFLTTNILLILDGLELDRNSGGPRRNSQLVGSCQRRAGYTGIPFFPSFPFFPLILFPRHGGRRTVQKARKGHKSKKATRPSGSHEQHRQDRRFPRELPSSRGHREELQHREEE